MRTETKITLDFAGLRSETLFIQDPSLWQKFTHALNPWCNRNHLIVPNAFSFEILKSLNPGTSDFWLLRDGTLPFFYFYKDFLQTYQGKPQFGIHHSLFSLFDDKRRSRFKFYRMLSRKPEKKHKLMLTALLGSSFKDAEQVHRQVRSLIEAVGTHFSEIWLYTPHRIWTAQTNEGFLAAAYAAIFTNFVGKFVPMTWNHLVEMKDFSEFVFADLTPPMLVAESYVSHFFLSKGATSVDSLIYANEAGDFIPLSRHHGVLLQDASQLQKPVLSESLELDFYFGSDFKMSLDLPQVFSSIKENWSRNGDGKKRSRVRQVK